MSKKVLIIGANKGIGLEFCKQYTAAGHDVIAVCRSASEALDEIGCQIIDSIDVTDDTATQRMCEEIEWSSIDILIHNAGILEMDEFPDIDLSVMQHHFDVNTLGPLRTILALRSKLTKGSKVGIVSSRVGSIDDNSSSNNYAYRVSKTAVNMVGKCLSIDLAEDEIAVALLHPGFVKTSMTKNNGNIEADEAASGLIKRMDELNMSTTGSFVHSNGDKLPW